MGTNPAPSHPNRDPDMTITLRFWEIPGGVDVNRDVVLGSDKYRAVEAALEPHHHDAVFKLMRLYTEPFIGLFILCGDVSEMRTAFNEATQ